MACQVLLGRVMLGEAAIYAANPPMLKAGAIDDAIKLS